MTAASALEGLRVLDVTQVMAGPFCAMMLADLGADVIKIEPPSGDSTRQMPGAVGTDSPSFNAVNRGKRGIVIDLKSARGRDVFVRIARSADIVVENYRPGVMTALGLDYERTVGGESAAHLRVDLGLRADRAVARQGRLRSDRARRLRHHVRDRRAGRTAGKGGRAADRSRRRSLRARRHSGGGRKPPSNRVPDSRSTPRSSTPASRCRCGKPLSTSPASACRRRSDRRIECSRRIRRFAAPTATSRSARETIGCSSACASCSAIPSGRRCRNSPTTRAVSGIKRRSRRSSSRSRRLRTVRRLARRLSTRLVSRADRSTTTRRCSPIRRYARATWCVEIEHPTLGAQRALGSPIKMSGDAGQCGAPRAASRRAHRRRSRRDGFLARGNRRLASRRRRVVSPCYRRRARDACRREKLERRRTRRRA